MLRSFKILTVVFIIAAAYSCKHDTQIPISDFFNTQVRGGFKISPDGKYVSYVKLDTQKRAKQDTQKQARPQRQNLYIAWVEDVANNTGKEQKISAFQGRDYQWTYDNKIVFNQGDRIKNESKLLVLDVATLKMQTILSEKTKSIRIINRSRQEPDVLTLEMNLRDTLFYDVYKLNIKTGELKTYIVNPGKVTEWYPGADGKILLAKESDGVDETILYRPNETAPFKPIIKNNFKESVTPIAFSNSKSSFYALSNVNRDKIALVTINPQKGKEEQVVYASDKADIFVHYSTNKHRLDFASWQEEKPKRYFLNGAIQQVYKSLAKHTELTDYEIDIASTDTAESKFIVRASTDRDQGASYLYQSKNDKLTLLVDNSIIQPDQLCAMKPISYKSRDGITINGYLTLPKGDTTNLPVVVMVHDGLVVPFNRDLWSYNSDVQFLANRGYAVLQVNYRGSIGYGKAFYSAGFRQAGGKIQDDITDGVNWIIANKIANPKKIAIYGNGFGAFSALYGLSFHPELYNCAIVQNPLINFLTYVQQNSPFFRSSVQMMYERVGDPDKDQDQFKAISPVFYPEKIKAPLLVFLGGRNANANLDQLDRYVNAVRKHGITVDYQKKNNNNIPDRSAALRNQERIDRYKEIEKFLDTHMPARH